MTKNGVPLSLNNKKKLLLACGGYADIPLIKAAKSLGYYVVTTGNRPEEMGHKVSDEYRPADFSEPEIRAFTRQWFSENELAEECLQKIESDLN